MLKLFIFTVTPSLPRFNLIKSITTFIAREIVVANAIPTTPSPNFTRTKFNIIFITFATPVAIIGVLVSLIDLKQLDKIRDKQRNTTGTTTII